MYEPYCTRVCVWVYKLIRNVFVLVPCVMDVANYCCYYRNVHSKLLQKAENDWHGMEDGRFCGWWSICRKLSTNRLWLKSRLNRYSRENLCIWSKCAEPKYVWLILNWFCLFFIYQWFSMHFFDNIHSRISCGTLFADVVSRFNYSQHFSNIIHFIVWLKWF